MKNIIKILRSNSGNSLAEFAVVIALMATLMSTGQVKFSQAGEGGKGKKVGEELDKVAKAANNFYNAVNDAEGAGRFPGQDKWDKDVPLGAWTGKSLADAVASVTAWGSYLDASSNNATKWCSVFGRSVQVKGKNMMHPDHRNKIHDDDQADTGGETRAGPVEFGDYIDPVASPFLDGNFIYTVVHGAPGITPGIIITDFYAPNQEYIVAQP